MYLRISISIIFFLISILVSFEASAREKAAGTAEPADYEEEYTATLNDTSQVVVSDLLMGFNLVYPQESDAIWQDGKVKGYLQDVNNSILRWPGGTVSTYYHWNDLTGKRPPWRDNWNPDADITVQPESEFMDLDQYMDLIRETGAEPLLGINMDSGRRWDRMQDGIDEALALMQYCEDNDFEVTYWYLGNEPYLDDSNGGVKTPQEYAELINTYADAMREVDPDIKIVANWRQGIERNSNEYWTLMSTAGHNIDLIDMHWYWSWGSPSMEKWLSTTPMEIWTGNTYMEEISDFRNKIDYWSSDENWDFSHVRLASLEWNVGPINDGQITSHQAALIQSEMMMQFMLGGLDMATFWPLQWPNTKNTRRSFIDRYNNNAAQPNYNLFKYLSRFQGGFVVEDEASESPAHVLNLVAMDKENDILRVGFLNKNEHGVRVNLNSEHFGDAYFHSGESYVLSGDGTTHELKSVTELLEDGDDGISFVAEPLSMTMLSFEGVSIPVSAAEESSGAAEQPSAYVLHQNFPNPFNPTTVIRYELAEDSDVRLEVFNMLGQRVAMLVNEHQSAGQHRALFDASNLSSGMYLYRIQAGPFVDTRKMTIVK